MYIYKVTNKINGKIYVGQTKKNIDSDYLGSGPIILKAVKKYGKENFKKEIIENCNSQEQLNEQEIFWIKELNATDRNIGYNISIGGNGGNLGELVNKKISKKLKGFTLVKDKEGNNFHVKTNDHRYLSGELVGFHKGMIPYNKGIPMSEEQKNKLRKPKSEEHKKNMSISRKGKVKKYIICLNDGLVYTMPDAAIKFNLTVPNIIAVLKGRAKYTKGFIFEYCNKPN